MKTLRKTAITIAMAAIACAVFTACGTGNDDGAVQPKEVVATKAVVTTAAEQTEAKKTTTTEAIEDSEPEVKKTTTEAITTSEPETTESEATTTEEPKEDNPEGMYTLEECFRRKAEEYSGQKVVKVEIDESTFKYEAILENGGKAYLSVYVGYSYEPDELIPIANFELVGSDVLGYDVVIELHNY